MVSGQSDDDCNGLLLLLDSLFDDRDAALGGLGVSCSASNSSSSSHSGADAAAVDEPADRNDDDLELTPLVELVSSDDITGADSSTLAPDHAFEIESVLTSALEHVRPAQPQAQFERASRDKERANNPTTSAALVPSSAGSQIKTPRATGASSSSSGKRMNANKARDERKSELIYLRKKVSELETHLSTIRAKRPRIATAASTATTTPPSDSTSQATAHASSQSSVGARMWQEIALRQRDERAAAERENVRLKLVLENQLRVAKSLETILNKKSTTKDMHEFVDRSGEHVPVATDASDAAEFDALLTYVEQMFVDLDGVFHENGLARTEAPLSTAEMRASVQRGMFLEICANKVLPFDIFATSDAVWHHFAFAKEHTPFRCYTYTSSSKLRSTEDTIMEHFVLKLDAKGTDANFRVKQVLRRHVEADRIVIVWRAAFEAFEFSDEPVSGMRFHENGYIVIKKPQSIAGNYSLLQTCYITTPNFPADLSIVTNPRVGAISDFVLAATAANVSSTHQMIENVLLEQALKRTDRLALAS